MNLDSRPKRVILNFAHRCAMKCEWCYVPFASQPAKKHTVCAIVHRIADLEFTALTLGGGDPFQYSFLPDVLSIAKKRKLFVHVDTHGRSMRETDSVRHCIEECVDLIGLPLDGSTAAVHDAMRSSPGHFDLVCRRIDWLGSAKDRLKINTIVSAKNIDDVSSLADLVTSIEPRRWSIYQFWPLGPAKLVSNIHNLTDVKFGSSMRGLNTRTERMTGITVEQNSAESRRDTYPIVHHDGAVSVHLPFPENEFVSLGSIFDADILSKILERCRSERSAARSRY
jgi:MoaA/NifB/PqqE/SkfB family radical SAM enzyme